MAGGKRFPHTLGWKYGRAYKTSSSTSKMNTLDYILSTGDWSNYDKLVERARETNTVPHIRVTFNQVPRVRISPEAYDGVELPFVEGGHLDFRKQDALDFARKVCRLFADRYEDAPVVWDVLAPGKSGEADGSFYGATKYGRDVWMKAQMDLMKISCDVFGAQTCVIHIGSYGEVLDEFVRLGGRMARTDNWGGRNDMRIMLGVAGSDSPKSFLLDPERNPDGGLICETRFSLSDWVEKTGSELDLHPEGGMGDLSRIAGDTQRINGIALANMGEIVPPEYVDWVETQVMPGMERNLPAWVSDPWGSGEQGGGDGHQGGGDDEVSNQGVTLTLSGRSYADGYRLAGFTTKELEDDELTSGRAFDPAEFPFAEDDRTTKPLPAGVNRVWYQAPTTNVETEYPIARFESAVAGGNDRTLYLGVYRPNAPTIVTLPPPNDTEDTGETDDLRAENERLKARNAVLETAFAEVTRILSDAQYNG